MQTNSNKIVIVLLVIAVLVLGYFAFFKNRKTNDGVVVPQGQTQTNQNPNGPDYQLNPKPVISTTLPTPYVHGQGGTWPPTIQYSATLYSCNPPSHTNGMDKSSIERVINGRTYCIVTISEGAAGTIYKTYTYTTADTNRTDRAGTLTTTFTLGYQDSDCEIPNQQTACHTAQLNFDNNLDAIIDSLMR